MEIKYSLDDLYLFWHVCRAGSFSKAAELLQMPVSTLSRRVSRLEQDLDLRLLHRDAHRLQLTSAGEQYLQRCGPLFNELGQVSASLDQEARDASGLIRITAPVGVTRYWLGEMLNRFLQQYPAIDIDLILSNNNLDMVANQIDLAIRVGDPGLDNWIARPLLDFGFILCAAAQRPEWQGLGHPRELDQQPLVAVSPIINWDLETSDGQQQYRVLPAANTRVRVNDYDIATMTVKNGLGIGLLPCWLALPAIRRGELVRVLPQWLGQRRQSCLLYRDRDHQPYRLRLLIDFLLQQAQQEPTLEEWLEH